MRSFVCFALVAAFVCPGVVAAEPPGEAFLEAHCADCHSGGAAEGGFELSALTGDLSDAASLAKWVRVHDRIERGEMPPADWEQPEDAARKAVVAAMGEWISAGHAAEKGTVFRRLNRREYENTLNDLFGVRLDLASELPADGRSGEFDNVGESLSVSLVQIERYLAAIDRVMDAAIAARTEPPEVQTIRASYAETREGEKFIGDVWKKLPDGAVAIFRSRGYPGGMLRGTEPKHAGRHRVRVTGYAYQSAEPITFALGGTSFERASGKPTYGYFAFPPLSETGGEPTTIEVEVDIPERYMVEITPQGIQDENNEIKKDGVDAYRGPGLAILSVEVVGPLPEPFPSRGHKLLLGGLDRREVMPGNPKMREKPWYVPRFEIETDSPQRDAAKVLARVAREAFRRPVEPGELARFERLFASELESGETFEDALKTAVAAIFCSPEFLFLDEPAGPLTDHALAARLSYFLARTTPDDELSRLADAGRLTDPAALRAQAERLIADRRFERFLVDFTDAWLDLREIEFTSPDDVLFPEFDAYLQWSMLAETRGFVAELVRENAPVRSLVRPGFAMLNERLAAHYGLPELAETLGPDVRRVPLDAAHPRGGLLGQAAIHKVSANGTNTSPVVRGVYVVERLLGEPPQPPPPGIPGVEPDIRGAETLRQLLAKHRDQENCRACHAAIDPPGFALESFDPIGGWRDNYRSLGAGERVRLRVRGRNVRYRVGPPVDASGELPTGESFAGFVEFRDRLADDELRLARAFVGKLLVFATGREMGFSDRPEIDRIARRAVAEDLGLRDILLAVVASDIFRTK